MTTPCPTWCTNTHTSPYDTSIHTKRIAQIGAIDVELAQHDGADVVRTLVGDGAELILLDLTPCDADSIGYTLHTSGATGDTERYAAALINAAAILNA